MLWLFSFHFFFALHFVIGFCFAIGRDASTTPLVVPSKMPASGIFAVLCAIVPALVSVVPSQSGPAFIGYYQVPLFWKFDICAKLCKDPPCIDGRRTADDKASHRWWGFFFIVPVSSSDDCRVVSRSEDFDLFV